MKPNSFHPVTITVLIAVLVAPGAGGAAPSAPAAAPDFVLLKRDSGEPVKLADFAGEIIVLDFFAYWCGPCRKSAVEIEGGIQKYYAAKQGNPQGVPVRVVSVNIEQDNPRQTDKYIRETGAEFVLNDLGGKLLEKFGGVATPFIVVIDGSRATRETPDFRVLHKSEGFEGTKKLRELIDGIKPPPRRASISLREPGAAVAAATGAPVARAGEVSFETMLASDIKITSSAFSYGQKQGGTEWKLNYTYGTIGEDYEPFKEFDFFGTSACLYEEYNGGAASVRQKLSRSLTLSATGGGYVGFTDFRSVWLANYYKQQFDFVPGYEPPTPRGYNVSAGLRWEYQPTTGFVDASFLYANDEIAPGYEFDPFRGELVRGPEILKTYAPALKFENVLTSRIRALNEFQLTFTSGREVRYAYRGSVNVALGERCVWRTLGGYTQEDPTLRAWFVGSTLEFEIAPRWLLSISGLYYHDTGEIENSTLISTAAPGLETWRGGLGLRYVGEVSSFSLSAAPVWSDYEPVAVGTRPFTNLYKSRDWISLQAAWVIAF